MGAELAEAFAAAREVFEEVDDALGEKLSTTDARGADGDADADRERPAGADGGQPGGGARAGERIRRADRDDAAFVAGHSLGEYSALAAAGALTLADAARLLQLRGQAMQQAVPVGEGAMAALIGLEDDVRWRGRRGGRREGGVCAVANDNNAGNVVISGTRRAVEQRHREGQGARAPSARFRCRSAPRSTAPLMQPAADEMAEALAAVDTAAPRCRWSPTSPPGRPTIRRRSAASWSSR